MLTSPTSAPLNAATRSEAAPAAAPDREDASLKEVARQFETLFVKMALKNMRATSFGPDMMGGEKNSVYRDMLDGEFAKAAGGQGGLGIADLLYEQLRGAPASSAASGYVPPAAGLQGARVEAVRPLDDRRPATPAEFVDQYWPHAREAARELGVSPQIILAQAALESGWGSAPTGRHNLFGIKADAGWQGPRVEQATHEFVGGEKRSERAAFRDYGSARESFADYVRFIKNNPRYAVALEHSGDDQAYVQGLQSAGYATDPAYADKIARIAAQMPTDVAAVDRQRAD